MRRALVLWGLCLWLAAAPADAATTYVAAEDVAAGDVVTFNAAGDIIKAGSGSVVVGVVFQAASATQPVAVETTDDITVKVLPGTAALQYLNPSTTVGVASGTATPTASTFGYSRTAESGGTLSMQFLRVDGGGAGGGGTHPVDLASDVTGVLADANVAASLHRDAETKDGDSVSFDDADANFSAVTVDDALSELDDPNAGGPNAADAKVDWTQLGHVPADFADGEVDASDLEEVGGVARSELVFFIPFDDEGRDAPRLVQGNGIVRAPVSSGVGLQHNYRMDHSLHDLGLDALDPAAGSALPAGIKSAVRGLFFDTTLDTTVTIARDPAWSLLATENLLAVTAFKQVSHDTQWRPAWDSLSGTNFGFTFDYNGTNTRLVLGDGATRVIALNDQTDNTEHWGVGIFDQTNRTGYVDGVQVSQFAKARTGSMLFNRGSVILGRGPNAGPDGDWYYFALWEAAAHLPADIPAWLQGITPADDREFIGSRSMRGKFGEARVFLGSDYERYDSEILEGMRREGTVSLWFQPIFDSGTTTVTTDCTFFVASASGGSEFLDLRFVPDAVSPKWIARAVTGSGTVTAELLATGANVHTKGTWKHLAMTWTGTTLSLYVDGVLAQAAPLGAEPLPAGELDTTFSIGNSAGGGGDGTPANGLIDHFKGDNRAWTGVEIAREAAATRAN